MSQIFKNCHPTKFVYAKNVKNWHFFQERNATKQDWLAWFYKSKDNTVDHRSYAEVLRTKNTSPSILPPTPPSLIVVNLDSSEKKGSLWIVLHYISNHIVEHFDSIGRKPDKYINNILFKQNLTYK